MEVTEEQINKAIKKCKYRTTFDVCSMAVLPCRRAIEAGKCTVLIALLAREKEWEQYK